MVRLRLDDVLPWALACAIAGLLLSLAQMAVAAAGGVLPPPPITLMAAAVSTLVVVVCGVLLGIGFHLAGAGASRATLIGATVGPLAWVAMGPVWTTGGPVVGGAMGAIAAAWGIAGVWVAEGLTRSGRPPAMTWFWGAVALLLAGLSRLAAPGWGLEVPAAALLGIFGLLFCFVVGPTGVRSARRLLVWLSGIVTVCAFLPWMLPWMLWDPDVSEVGPWPPNFAYVLLDLEAGDERDIPIPTYEVMKAGAVRYRVLRTEPLADALMGLPNGDLIAPRLDARGYATAAVLPRPGALAIGVRDVDARAGGLGQLASTAGWMAGAPWLRGPAAILLAWTGHDRTVRSPVQLADAAGAWLLNWRALRAPAPFQLVLDLRTPDASSEAIDLALQGLLEDLTELGAQGVTLLVLAMEGEAGSGEGEVLLVPPASWPRVRQPPADQAIWGRELGGAILQLADSRYGRPVLLPGPVELHTVLR